MMVPVYLGLCDTWAYKWRCSTRTRGLAGDVPRHLRSIWAEGKLREGQEGLWGKGKGSQRTKRSPRAGLVKIWTRERSQRRGSHGQTERLAFKVLDMGKLVSEVEWVLLAIVECS